MPTFVSSNSSSEFVPAPPGTHQAVCVDVIDLGIVETSYGKKHKVAIRWQIDELMPNGKRYMVQKRYTASLNEKAVLRHDLQSWRGRPFSDDELNQFDLDTVIGANALIGIMHNVSQGKTWANVTSVMPLAKAMQKMAPVDYMRKVADTATDPGPDGENDTRQYDDSVPF